MAEQNITIRARCLCKKHNFTASIPTESLPLSVTVCHCTSCRHNSGTLYTSCALWPNHEDISALHRFIVSPNTDVYSCGTCSTQMFATTTHAPGKFFVSTGALDNTPNLLRYDRHMFVGDTKDGGASSWLMRGPGEDAPVQRRWMTHVGHSEELPVSWPDNGAKNRPELDKKASPEFTPLWCRCKGVNFLLKSGTDLAAGTDQQMTAPPDAASGRYMTSLDACDSCRLAVGVDMVSWAFATVDHLYLASDPDGVSGPPFQTIHDLSDAVAQKDPRVGTLAVYKSSPGVERYHCSNCSATIFFTEHRLKHGIDVAVGLLDHPDGARAEGFLKWDHGHIDHIADTKGGWREDFTEKISQEAKSGAGSGT